MIDATSPSRAERLLLLRVLPLLFAGCLPVWLVFGAVRLIVDERVGLVNRGHRAYILNPLMGNIEEQTGLLEGGWRVVHVASVAASRTESTVHRCTFVCREKTTGKDELAHRAPHARDE